MYNTHFRLDLDFYFAPKGVRSYMSLLRCTTIFVLNAQQIILISQVEGLPIVFKCGKDYKTH